MAGPKSDLITVSVPPEADPFRCCAPSRHRSPARMNMPFDGIEDLRLAVDEACAWLLGLAREATSLTLRLRPMDDRLEAVVSIDAAGRAWPPPDLEQSLSWKVLSALVDTVSLDAEASGPSIRLIKRTLEPSRTA